MSKPRPSRAVGVRLLHVVDAYLRKKQRGKGDMSKLIYEALTRMDLSSVPLITIHGKRQPTVAKVTQIVMPNEIRQQIEHWAENRLCSMNEMLNSALVASLPNARRDRDRKPVALAHPTVADKMTAAQRELFFAQLLSLTGSDATPSLRSREGSYYEYDSEAGGTVEITRDGRRFLVEFAGGGELVRVREVVKSPFLEVSQATRPRAVAASGRRTTQLSTAAEDFAKMSAIQLKKRDDSPPDGPVRPILLLLVGASGSGRTTFYETHLKTVFPKILKASTSPLEQAETDLERKRLLKAGGSFVCQDVTFDLRILRKAKSAGYEVKAVFVGTEDPTLNLGRIMIRVNNGGPFAPISRIPQDYTDGLKQLSEMKKLADDLILFDNTPHARGVRLIAHFRDRELVKLARVIPKWAQKEFGKEFAKWLTASS